MSSTEPVLLVSYAYPPITAPGALRVSKFAKYLVEHGWAPTVLTVEGGYSLITDADAKTEIPGVEVVRVREASAKSAMAKAGGGTPTSSGGLKSAVKAQLRACMIPDRDFTWIKPATAKAIEVARQIGTKVVFSSSPTISNHQVARQVSRELGLPWVADFRDPWTVGAQYANPAWRKPIDRRIEREIIRGASAITVVSEYIAKLFKDAYPEHAHKFQVIYNGFDPDDFADLAASPIRDKFVLAYAGSFYGGKRDPLALFQAVARLRERGILDSSRFGIELIGRPEAEIQAHIEATGIGDLVSVTGQVPYDECLRRLAAASEVLVITFPDPLSKGELTTKLFEYLALGRPILAMVPTDFELAQTVRRFEAGVTFEPGDSAGIEAHLEAAVRSHFAEGPKTMCAEGVGLLSRRAGTEKLSQILRAAKGSG